MKKEEFIKNELIEELKNVSLLIEKEKNVEKKIYYFSAAYGITSRTFRYTYNDDYVLADCVLNVAYNGFLDRINRIKGGDPNIKIEEIHFTRLSEGLNELAEAFEKDESILEPLKKIMSTAFSVSGPGNYIREKGMMNF